MSYLYSKIAQWVTTVLLVIALAVLWFLFISEEQAILQDSSQRLSDEKLTIRGMEVQLGKTKSTATLYQRNLEEIDYFRANFLQRKNARLRDISRFLNETAKAHELALDQVDYNLAPSRERDLEVQQISLPLTGRYRDIRAFVEDVEASDLFLIIVELSLEEEAPNGIVAVELVLATYFQGGGA